MSGGDGEQAAGGEDSFRDPDAVQRLRGPAIDRRVNKGLDDL